MDILKNLIVYVKFVIDEYWKNSSMLFLKWLFD